MSINEGCAQLFRVPCFGERSVFYSLIPERLDHHRLLETFEALKTIKEIRSCKTGNARLSTCDDS